jgi:16S rRNA (uracil1498-N3)-methyltransferase
VERHGRAPVVGFFWSDAFAMGDVRLEGSPVQHARARRVQRGDSVRLVDGRGRVGYGELLSLGKDQLTVSIERVVEVPRPATLEVIVPVADKERMLWAAEKCAELQITSWRPVHFARSRSVTPRGEGPKFSEKISARMQSALEQSSAAWMPDIHHEAEAIDVLRSIPSEWKRLLLDVSGNPLARIVSNGPTSIAVGPEGGLERNEITAAEERGWKLSSLTLTTLRFETAVVAAAAVIRATQLSLGSV